MDSAANCNAVSLNFIKKIDPNFSLPKNEGFIRGFNNSLTKSLGCVDLELKFAGFEKTMRFHIIQNLSYSLILSAGSFKTVEIQYEDDEKPFSLKYE